MRRSSMFCGLSLVLIAAFPFAASAKRSDLSPAKALSYVRANDLHFSPDGRQLAYVTTSYLWDAKPHLALVDPGTGDTREVTPSGKAERSPRCRRTEDR